MVKMANRIRRRSAIMIAIVVTALIIFFTRSTASTDIQPITVSAKSNAVASGADAATSNVPDRSRVITPQIPPKDMSDMTLEEKLAYQFPYDVEGRFPAYIWQTWKYTPGDGRFAEEFRQAEASWSEKHPGFIHEVVTDTVALHLMRYLYAGVPEVLKAYEAMPMAILKADFFRYLILLARGGIYSDIDTHALKSAVEWVPPNVPRSTYGLIVGIEADPDRPDWKDWYSRRIQFCQWTIQSKPGHPILRQIVANITSTTLSKLADGTLKKMTDDEVVDFTGPAVWTDTIFGFFNDERYYTITEDMNDITWEDFTGMVAPKKVGDVVILPITSFSPGQMTMGSENVDHPMAFVQHDFEGTWKPDNLRHIGIVYDGTEDQQIEAQKQAQQPKR